MGITKQKGIHILKELVHSALGLEYVEDVRLMPNGKWHKLRAALWNSFSEEAVIAKMFTELSLYKWKASHWSICRPLEDMPDCHSNGRIAVMEKEVPNVVGG